MSSECIFCKIVAGRLPACRVYEDADCLAFLDIGPIVHGHTLVIPKRVTARNLLDIDTDHLCKLAAATQKVARAVAEELEPAGIQIAQFNGAPAGQTVFHIHFHIVPRYEGESLGVHAAHKADEAELQALRERLAKRLANG